MEHLLTQYTNTVQTLLARLAQYDDVTLNRTPAAGGWSVLQVCEHLYRAEQNMLTQMAKKIEKADSFAPMTLSTKVKYGIMWTMFQIPTLRFKAPDFVAQLHDSDTLANTTLAWQTTHAALAESLAALPAAHSRKALFTHPAIGRIDAAYMLRFMELHTQRHIVQIDKLLRQAA